MSKPSTSCEESQTWNIFLNNHVSQFTFDRRHIVHFNVTTAPALNSGRNGRLIASRGFHEAGKANNTSLVGFLNSHTVHGALPCELRSGATGCGHPWRYQCPSHTVLLWRPRHLWSCS